MKVEKNVATTLNAFYRNNGEKMPQYLKILIFNYNLQEKKYNDLLKLVKNGDKDDKGDMDGDKDKEEVIRFILDPDNAYTLGKFGHSSYIMDTEDKIVVGGKVIRSEEEVLKLLL